ncbi:MAG: hypothetical protein ACKVQA_01810 [Burkholderiales bacterium]
MIWLTAEPDRAQTTSIKAEYLLTYVAPLDGPYPIDSSLLIVNVKASGGGRKDQVSAEHFYNRAGIGCV